MGRDLLPSEITQNERDYDAYYKNGIKGDEAQRRERTIIQGDGVGGFFFFFKCTLRSPCHLASAPVRLMVKPQKSESISK